MNSPQVNVSQGLGEVVGGEGKHESGHKGPQPVAGQIVDQKIRADGPDPQPEQGCAEEVSGPTDARGREELLSSLGTITAFRERMQDLVVPAS